MTILLLDHLWQSTLFVLGIALLARMFRRNGAHVRYGLWLAASVKFLIPFALLSFAGSQIASGPVWHPQFEPLNKWIEVALAPASARADADAAHSRPAPTRLEPASAAAQSAVPELQPVAATQPESYGLATLCGLVWAAGASLALLLWLSRWLRMRRLVGGAVPHHSPETQGMTIPVLESGSSVEPGVAGIFRPVLLLPRGIAGRLTGAQLRAVLAHELAHCRRRDNLTASIHMLVEVIFWFHPLVWWVGAQLVREREHACDEAVLKHGVHAHDYAEGILNVCEYYVAPPLRSSAISGGDLRLRIQRITNHLDPEALGMTRKTLLAGFALAVAIGPLLLGASGMTRAAAAPAALAGPRDPKLDSLYAAALQEGEVSVMVMDSRDAQWMRAAFAAAFPGIRLRVTASLGHLPLVIADAESGRPSLDVVLTSQIESRALEQAGYLASPDWAPFALPASHIGLRGHFAYTNNIVYTVAYDERRVGAGVIPVNWRELLDPRYRGVMSTNAFVMPRILAGLGLTWGAAATENFTSELLASQQLLVRFGDAKLYFLDEKDDHRYYIGMVSTVTEQWESQGIPSGYVVPEPVVMEQQGTVVLATAPHPSAARLLAGWLATEPAKMVRKLEAQSADLLPDSSDPLALALRARNVEIVYDRPEAADERIRLAENFHKVFTPGPYNPYQRLPALSIRFLPPLPE